MIGWIGRMATRKGRVAAGIAFVALVVFALVGGGVKDRLSVGGFVDPSAESTVAAKQLEATFGTAPPNYVLVATALDGDVVDVANRESGLELVKRLDATPGVLDVTSAWTLGTFPEGTRNPLRSIKGDRAVIALRLAGDEDEQRATANGLARYSGRQGHLDVVATGPAEVSKEAATQAEKDLMRAELIAAPLTLVGLLVVFRGWRAALIPLAVSVFAVLGTFSALTLIAGFTTVSVFALNLTTALGLGLAIDYSLLMVSRFREERTAGRSVDIAIHRTVQTAGRTVLFSAATVALSMLALLVFPVAFLRSFAFAGVAVVTIAGVAAVLIVPMLLARFGERIGFEATPHAGRFWGRQARRVMRRPWLWLVGLGVVLLAVGLPFRSVDPGRVDDRVLPADAPARVGADQLRRDFYFVEFNPISVVTPWIDPTDNAALTDFETKLLQLPNVFRVDSAHGFVGVGLTIPATDYNARFRAGPGDGTWFDVVSSVGPDTHDAEDLVADIRSVDSRVQVTGTTAVAADTVDSVVDRIPLALAIIALTTLVLLFFMTGSVVVPVKAVLLNFLSLTATFGVLVWVFQEGHFAGLFGVTSTGRIDVFTPILMFCVAFGLSMDYEVFLLARIKECYDLSGDNVGSVAEGLARTGRVVTAAALLLAVVFVAIATSGVTIVKMFGVGLALAVLVDAFLVRATLVPAFMRLAGRANWWAPRSLRRFHLRWGVWESEPVDLRTTGAVVSEQEPTQAAPESPTT
jgi:putative drug exporter of the RND superfamily